LKRPPAWLRIVSALALVLFGSQLLLNDQDMLSLLSGLVACALLLLGVIAPPYLYDGRWESWLERHRVVRIAIPVVLIGACIFFLVARSSAS
jgi:threonine/homoserine/homoserine lactone efflux protein